MNIKQCPICQSYLIDSNLPCPNCYFTEELNSEELTKLISDRLEDYQGEINQTIQLVRLFKKLETEDFLEFKIDILYALVFNYTKLFGRLPEWSEEQLSLIKGLPNYLRRTPYPIEENNENSEVEQEVLETEEPDEKEVETNRLWVKNNKKKIRVLEDEKLNLRLLEQPDYDGYYDTILPVDFDEKSPQIEKVSQLKQLGLTGLLSLLTIIAVTAFTLPFLI